MARTRALWALLVVVWPLSASATKVEKVDWVTRDEGYSLSIPSKDVYPKNTVYSLMFPYMSYENIVPWQYSSPTTIKLAIHVNDILRPAEKLTVLVQDIVGRGKHTFTTFKLPSKSTGEKIFIADLGTAAQLKALLHFQVSKNLLMVTVTDEDGRTLPAAPLYVLEQQAIVLLPGVLASEVYIKDKGKDVKRWPQPMQTAQGMTEGLISNDDGTPKHEASLLRVIEQPVVGGPYHITKMQEWLNEGLPILKAGPTPDKEQPVPLIYVQEYPYDWRYKPEVIIDKLLGPGVDKNLDQRPAYSFQDAPSLRTIHAALKKKLPFLSDKLAVAGHSTGGLIVNGLIHRKGVEQIVSHAFFIATPFYGTTKAYYVFLEGSMRLGVVEPLVLGQELLRKIGVNLAVLYYLAPTRDYPGSVANVSETQKESHAYSRKPVPKGPWDIGASATLIDKLMEIRTKNGEDNSSRKWNRGLEMAAEQYHKACTAQPVIPVGNVKVFYSEYENVTCIDPLTNDVEREPCTTFGEILYDSWKGPGKRLDFKSVVGDQTVPTESLEGPWKGQSQVVLVNENVDHLGIVSTAQIWYTMRDSLFQ
jgi:hypothetical protein